MGEEEAFDFFGAGETSGNFHEPLAGWAVERILAPDVEDEIKPEGADVAGALRSGRPLTRQHPIRCAAFVAPRPLPSGLALGLERNLKFLGKSATQLFTGEGVANAKTAIGKK